MIRSQRQNLFDRFFTALAREYSRILGLEYVGTLRKLPPPPFPGERQGPTRYYVNAFSTGGASTRLVEFDAKRYETLRRAAEWVESGRGVPPAFKPVNPPRAHPSAKKTKNRNL